MRARPADRLTAELRRAPGGWRRRTRQRIARRVLVRLNDQPILHIHIGKTAGTALQHLLHHLSDDTDPAVLERLRIRRAPIKLHHYEVPELLRDPGFARAERTFVFRDPAERYASGFLERLRQGRPTARPGVQVWSDGEAAAFGWFSTPNACFEGLSSDDEGVRSAALFAMRAIYHLRRDHVHYLGDAATFQRERARYRFFCPMEEFPGHIERFFDLGPGADVQALRDLVPTVRVSTGAPAGLSELARANLRAYRPEEFELHELLLEEWEGLR
ncbi:MAG: hypothetical protein RLZZ272_338 [Actinomycetota bacterium]